MAIRTIRFAVVSGKISFMIISVTIVATGMGEGISEFRPVTVAAGYLFVHPFQGESCFGMVKLFRIYNLVEPRFGMALAAIFSKPPHVRICMARRAARKLQPFKILIALFVSGDDRMA